MGRGSYPVASRRWGTSFAPFIFQTTKSTQVLLNGQRAFCEKADPGLSGLASVIQKQCVLLDRNRLQNRKVLRVFRTVVGYLDMVTRQESAHQGFCHTRADNIMRLNNQVRPG